MKAMLVMLLAALSATAQASDESCRQLAKKISALQEGVAAAYESPPCKAMPDYPDKTIIVLQDEIAVVDSSGRIFSRGPIGSTPSGSVPALIDTAPYWLSPTARAFGVRFSAYYPHYHGGESHQTMNMYVIEGESIRPVMELLIMNLEAGVEECKNGDENDCTQSTWTNASTVSLAKTRHNGYADLIVKMRDAAGKVISARTLTYDASHYVGPADAMEDPVDPVQ